MTPQPLNIGPTETAQMLVAGAILIDIRDRDEHIRERIEGAQNRPLETISPIAGHGPVIFHCRSGNRTAVNAARLRQACKGDFYILEGGIEAWKSAGQPVVTDKRQPLDIMRQVQIIGGSLILLAVLLALFFGPYFMAIAAGIGAGMIHAGLTGSCAMARLLAPLPWNRRARA